MILITTVSCASMMFESPFYKVQDNVQLQVRKPDDPSRLRPRMVIHAGVIQVMSMNVDGWSLGPEATPVE